MFRLFKKRTLWLPTWPVALGVIAIGLLAAGLLFLGSHDFLAVNKPAAGSKVMVVESWATDTSMEKVAALLNAEDSPYEQVWLVGPPLARGAFLSDRYKTYAALAMASLAELGVDSERLKAVPAADTQRHRTYTAGAQLRDLLTAEGATLERFDLVTIDVHARRSRLVYSKLFPDADIGVIALPPPGYDPDEWFRTSDGMKNTFFECVAYLYEKLADGGR